MVEKVQQIQVGQGGRLSRHFEDFTMPIIEYFGRSGKRSTSTRSSDGRGMHRNEPIDSYHIKKAVIPRLQEDLRNLQSTVENREKTGIDTTDTLRHYVNFVLLSLNADHQDPVVRPGSVETEDSTKGVPRNGTVESIPTVNATHTDTLIEY